MKIGHPTASIPESAPPASTARAAADAPAPAPHAADASAKVELSSTAASLRAGIKGATAEFDANKVASISHAIDSGTYKVNAEAIADKLIANAQEILGNVKR